MTNISSADRAHAEALAAYEANEDALRNLESQHAELLAAEDTARAALASGDSSETVLTTLTTNAAKAAALVPTIGTLKGQRAQLIHAVNLALGEQWAEVLRALAPEGTYAELQMIRDDLAETIRAAVSEARAKADALTTKAGELIVQARQFDDHHALPRGARYSPISGLTLDGKGFTAAYTSDLAELVGRTLDAEHTAQVYAETRARTAEQDRARAAVDAEHAAAVLALTSSPAR